MRYTPAAILALVATAMLALAPVALAVFTHAATGGPLTVATSKLAPPGDVTATQINCSTRENPEIEVTWSATSSSYATSYTVERSTASAGPYTALGNVPNGATSYTDQSSSLVSSTSYYYRVGVVYHSWGATSEVATINTFNKHCH
jgi:ABC-type glycerol-3-phosphate transport system substrate-binding protein